MAQMSRTALPSPADGELTRPAPAGPRTTPGSGKATPDADVGLTILTCPRPNRRTCPPIAGHSGCCLSVAMDKPAEPQFFGLPGPLLGRVGCPGPPSPAPLTATAHAPINARHLRVCSRSSAAISLRLGSRTRDLATVR